MPTECSPLKSVAKLAAEIKGLKEFPNGGSRSPGSSAGRCRGVDWKPDWRDAEYKIAPIPNPNPADAAGTKILAQCLTCTDESMLDGVEGCTYH